MKQHEQDKRNPAQQGGQWAEQQKKGQQKQQSQSEPLKKHGDPLLDDVEDRKPNPDRV